MKNKQILSWALVIIWISLIFVLSHQDATDSTVTSTRTEELLRILIINVRQDKWLENLLVTHIRTLAHFGLYLVLGALLVNAFGIKFMIQSISVGLLYAIFDETHQYFIPGRAFQIFDIFIDLLGVVFGVFIFKYLKTLIVQKS